MTSAYEVARFFIELAASDESADYMTNLRLQKLLFLAQGWHLARYGKPLFEERIEAWQFGPVVPKVYDQFKDYGREPIRSAAAKTALSAELADFLIELVVHYDSCTTSGLVEYTHSMPLWRNHQNQKSKLIPLDEIKAFFDTISPPVKSIDDMLEHIPVDYGKVLPNGTRVFADD